jgi:hypothetical protein
MLANLQRIWPVQLGASTPRNNDQYAPRTLPDEPAHPDIIDS